MQGCPAGRTRPFPFALRFPALPPARIFRAAGLAFALTAAARALDGPLRSSDFRVGAEVAAALSSDAPFAPPRMAQVSRKAMTADEPPAIAWPAEWPFAAAEAGAGPSPGEAADAARPAVPRDGPRRWLSRPVRFDLRQCPLGVFFRDFCVRQGVACHVSDKLDGTVTGQFEFDDPAELLDLIARAQGVLWYYDGAMAHFCAEAEAENRIFPLEGRLEADLRRTLGELGLLDDRYPWKNADGGRLLMVQGPAAYLQSIAEVLDRLAEAAALAPERELAVFRLRYAWASEQSLDFGSGKIRVPGVADLLRQLAGEQAAAEPPEAGAPRFLRGAGVVGRREAGEAPPEAASRAPFIQADTRQNAVLVWDRPESMARHRAVIEALDQPLALVEIRAAILDVEAGRIRDLGIAWEARGKTGSWGHAAGSNAGPGEGRVSYDAVSGDGFQYATIYSRGLDQLMARVSALEEDGTANILSRPSVLTQDNMQAVLEHTETFYVRLEGEREVDLADITTGLTMRVTPHVLQDGSGQAGVQLAVHISNGTDAYDTASRVDNLPRVRQSAITTQAVVYEGEALVVGGYYTETRRSTLTGVPGLKSIPGLGALFRRKGSETSKSERLFVLSPRIILPGNSRMRPGTEAERSMEASPVRDLMAGPSFDDLTPPPDPDTLRHGQAAGGGSRRWRQPVR